MLSIDNLKFSYPRKARLFDGLSLELRGGHVYGLLGKNGAGKTTLLKILSGLRYAQSGKCRALGYDPAQRSPLLLQEIYFIPEEFYTPPVTIAEYITLYAPFYPRFDHQQLKEFSQEFVLPRDGKLSTFSYGQKKKFLIAFGLATHCKLLILDEPTNGLDIPTKSKFRKVLAASIDEARTFIVSTHQVRDMDQLIDPIIILDDGKIIFDYSLPEVAKGLRFETQNETPGPETIYAEKALGGYTVVKANRGQAETTVDLEILFNAVLAQQNKIQEILKHEA